jgi:hypothetical protein
MEVVARFLGLLIRQMGRPHLHQGTGSTLKISLCVGALPPNAGATAEAANLDAAGSTVFNLNLAAHRNYLIPRWQSLQCTLILAGRACFRSQHV